jgi:hypothetical protein
MNAVGSRRYRAAKIILIGRDHNQTVEKRFQAAGCEVVRALDGAVALEIARHRLFDMAVLSAKGSLINTAEIVFNLRDLNQSMEVIILVERGAKNPDRYLQQWLDHPIEGTDIMTRRQLQKQLRASNEQRKGGSMSTKSR